MFEDLPESVPLSLKLYAIGINEPSLAGLIQRGGAVGPAGLCYYFG